MSQQGWKIDLSRCVGCKACVVACKSEQNTPLKTNFRWLVTQESGAYPAPVKVFISMACNHCKYPACMAACPSGAITKNPNTGIVTINKDVCVGCRRCSWACPYGAPQYNKESKKTEKCNFCVHRTFDANGVPTGKNPACVDSCVGRAITWGDLSSLGTSTYVPDGFADPALTLPSIRFEK